MNKNDEGNKNWLGGEGNKQKVKEKEKKLGGGK